MISSARDYDRLHTALDLLREAYDAVTNQESRVDLRDWCRTAKALLTEHDMMPIAVEGSVPELEIDQP